MITSIVVIEGFGTFFLNFGPFNRECRRSWKGIMSGHDPTFAGDDISAVLTASRERITSAAELAAAEQLGALDWSIPEAVTNRSSSGEHQFYFELPREFTGYFCFALTIDANQFEGHVSIGADS